MSASPNNYVTKWEWPRLFNAEYQKSFSVENVKKGFEVCGGIFPLNKSRVPGRAFAPSLPFDNKVTQLLSTTTDETITEHNDPLIGTITTDHIVAESFDVVESNVAARGDVLATADSVGTVTIVWKHDRGRETISFSTTSDLL